MAEYVMGVDVGTTGTKAIIFDLTGIEKGKAYQEYTCEYPQPNWVEQDARMLRQAVLDVCALAVRDAGVSGEEILSVSVSAQRCCILFSDDRGEIMKMISWLDNRADEEVAGLEKEVGTLKYYSITGLPLSTTWILPKILWMQKNEPEIWRHSKKILQLHDYILRCLGADDYYSDEPDASFWGFWETNHLKWNSKMLEMFHIKKEMLPQIKASGTCVGTISPEIAETLGLSKRTKLCVGAGDQNCAAIGAGVVRPGLASVSLGTGGLTTVFTSKPYRDPRGRTMVTNSAVHGNWQLEGLQNGAAGVYRWFRDEIAALEKYESERDGTDAYERLDRMVAAAPPGAKGLVFLPYLAAAASPRYDQNARGSLIGLTFQHTRGDIARAVIEGITLEQKDILTSMLRADIKFDHINIMGGATKSDLWNQLQADCYGYPVKTLQVKDAAVMGAAICACIGAGIFRDIPAASEVLVKPDRTYYPNPAMTSFYDESYRMYCDAYEGLSAIKMFDRIVKRQKHLG